MTKQEINTAKTTQLIADETGLSFKESNSWVKRDLEATNITCNECCRQKESLEALNEALREALRTHQNQVQCIIDSVLNKHKELLSQ